MPDITNKPFPIYNVRRGTDWRIPIKVVDADNLPWNFTGWQAHAQVRTKSSGTLIADFNTYDATIEFDGGTMYLIRDKDDTLIDPSEYEWDCKFLTDEGFLGGYIIKSIFEVIDGPTE